MVYACGPKGMLRAVSDIATEANVKVEVSLDERMACGLGACLGCIIYLKEGDEVVQKRCCVEGPVFDGSKVVWDTVCK
jgi:dihydroorotate dehydrogenase electron transfer subunit